MLRALTTAALVASLTVVLGGCPPTASVDGFVTAGALSESTGSQGSTPTDDGTTGETPSGETTQGDTAGTAGAGPLVTGGSHPPAAAPSSPSGQGETEDAPASAEQTQGEQYGESGSDSGGSGGTSGPTIVDQTVDLFVRQLVHMAAVFGTFAELGSPQLELTPNVLIEWGTCPEVTIAADGDLALISLDWNCTSPTMAGQVVIGANGDIYYYNGDPTPAAVYVTSDFAIAGRLITPYYIHQNYPTLPVLMSAQMTLHFPGATLAGPFDFATAGIGRAAGSITVYIAPGYTLTFGSPGLTLTATAGGSIAATLADVIVNATTYGSFVPASGTASFNVGSDPVTVSFTGQSPLDGTVMVSVNGATPYAHQVPGIP